jgi:hypothetical protein
MKTMAALAVLIGQDQDRRPGLFEWSKDLESAMAQSEKDGQPVMAYFTFDT